MMDRPRHDNPLAVLFHDIVSEQTAKHLGHDGYGPVRDYLTGLLVTFSRTDAIYSLKFPDGTPIRSVFEMLAEGDVRLNADSFEREREVHKHIGDYILYWSGVNPVVLTGGSGSVVEYQYQGGASYRIVGSFDYSPYELEAPLFLQMASEFDVLTHVLRDVGREANLYVA